VILVNDSDEVLEVIVDFVNGVESPCVQLRQHVAQLKDVEPERECKQRG